MDNGNEDEETAKGQRGGIQNMIRVYIVYYTVGTGDRLRGAGGEGLHKRCWSKEISSSMSYYGIVEEARIQYSSPLGPVPLLKEQE